MSTILQIAVSIVFGCGVTLGVMLAPVIAGYKYHSAPTHTPDNPNCFPRDTPGVEDFPLCPDNTRNEMETT